MLSSSSIIDPWSTNFVDDLVRAFRRDWAGLLRGREELRRDPRGHLAAVAALPSPLAMFDRGWKVPRAPRDLMDRRVEITGPAVDPRMAARALNSGASGYMVDGEDALSPTWDNVLRTQSTLTGISRRTLGRVGIGGDIPLNSRVAVLHFRPRGLHLLEKHWEVDGEPAPACLVDVGLFLWWNARELLDAGSGPYLYLPKMETELEARWWNRVLDWVEGRLRLDEGTIRCTALIETLPGLVRAENILWSLRTRATGLNVGRWDYIFSCVKTLSREDGYVLPDRSSVTMDSPALSEYSRWVVRVCHTRGAHAIGGMAAQVPSRKDPVAAAAAIEAVRRDKDREVAVGHDGTWVAHPDLVPVAMEAWESRLGLRVEQLWNVPSGDVLDLSAVATAPAGPRTEVGLRELVRSSLKYVSSWLDGNGCVAIDGKMEDAATAEVSRSMLWQWVARRAVLDDGRVVTVDLIDAVVRGETAALVAEGWTPRPEAVDLLVRSVISPAISEFMIGDAYEILTKPKF